MTKFVMVDLQRKTKGLESFPGSIGYQQPASVALLRLAEPLARSWVSLELSLT